jgi:hypothetical protein
MLLGSVIPIGLAFDRIGVLFGFMEAVAAVLYGLILLRMLKAV